MSVFRSLLADIRGIPKFTEVNWLQGNSYNINQNYIDTEYIPNSNTKVEMKYQFSSSVQHNYDRLFGGDGCFLSITYNGKQIYVRIGNTYSSWDYNGYNKPQQYFDRDYIVSADNSQVYIDNVVVATRSATEINTNKSILLFSNNTNDNDRNSCARVYYFKAWENDILVRDMIPVLDENNVPCFYDKITNKLYYNLGNGSFSWG